MHYDALLAYLLTAGQLHVVLFDVWGIRFSTGWVASWVYKYIWFWVRSSRVSYLLDWVDVNRPTNNSGTYRSISIQQVIYRSRWRSVKAVRSYSKWRQHTLIPLSLRMETSETTAKTFISAQCQMSCSSVAMWHRLECLLAQSVSKPKSTFFVASLFQHWLSCSAFLHNSCYWWGLGSVVKLYVCHMFKRLHTGWSKSKPLQNHQ